MADVALTLREHEIVGVDTSVFIYHFEGSSEFGSTAARVLEEIASGRCLGITSVITMMEIAVQPFALGRIDIGDQYDVLLSNFPNLQIVDVTSQVARRAAQYRAEYRLFPADALQIAAAAVHGATAFVCNDRRLRRVSIPKIVVLDDYTQSQPPALR